MTHILERFLIHFASSTCLTLVFFFALRYWVRTNSKVANWISGRKNHLLVVAALAVFALLPLREPFDVYFGTQVWYKAIFDQISWFLGPAVSVFGLYRFDAIGD
jgi:putative effector of murein hydrolase